MTAYSFNTGAQLLQDQNPLDKYKLIFKVQCAIALQTIQSYTPVWQ